MFNNPYNDKIIINLDLVKKVEKRLKSKSSILYFTDGDIVEVEESIATIWISYQEHVRNLNEEVKLCEKK